MNIGEVYFTLRGLSFDPEAVTAAIGVEPSRTERKADPIPRLSSWDLSSGKVVSEVIDVYALGEAVIARLRGCEEPILRVCAEYELEATLQVVLTVSPDDRYSTPAIGFSKEVVQFLCAIGASIDVDTYRGAS